MRIVIQRVHQATVTVDHKTKRTIGPGLVILLGITQNDSEDDIQWLCKKILQLRIFNDSAGVMNKSITEVEGSLLIVSQFTLYASTKKGNRPSYINAARPDIAIPLYKMFLNTIKSMTPLDIKTGEFGAHMDVALINNGPVTILIDSKERW